MAESNSEMPVYAFPRQIEVGHADARGVTLRDYFAGQAIAGVIRQCFADERWKGEDIPAMYARKSYEIADAMLLRRAK